MSLRHFPKWNPYASEKDKKAYLDRVFRWKEATEANMRLELEKAELYCKEADAIELQTARERKIARLFSEKGVASTIKEFLEDAETR